MVGLDHAAVTAAMHLVQRLAFVLLRVIVHVADSRVSSSRFLKWNVVRCAGISPLFAKVRSAASITATPGHRADGRLDQI